MKWAVGLLVALPGLALAQPVGHDDRLGVYRDLLSEANDRLATYAAMTVQQQRTIKALEAERDKLKASPAKPEK